MITFLPAELTTIDSLPVFAAPNVATGMTLRFMVVAESRLIVVSSVEPQSTLTMPHPLQVVATIAMLRAMTSRRT